MGILSFLGLDATKNVVSSIGGAAKFIGERVLPAKKMSEMERIEKYIQVYGISESSTESARQLFMTELKTQKQPLVIRYLNGLVRPFGGLGALITEFYAVWGANLGVWLDFEYIEVTITVEQHIILGTIIAFYFGSRLKETLSGVSTKR